MRNYPDYDTPIKINMEFEDALALLLRGDVATIDVETSHEMLQSSPEERWRRIDNCDGDPEILYAEWDRLTA